MENSPVSSKETKEEPPLPIHQYALGKSIELDVVGKKEQTYAENYKQMSRYVAGLFADAIEKGNTDSGKRKVVLGLAADTSPVGMLEEFSKIAQERQLDLSKVLIVRYEQGYGSGANLHEPEADFDTFHKELFFDANNIVPQSAEIKTDEDGKQYVDGNFIPLFVEYKDEGSSEEIQKRTKEVDRILSVVGKLDFAVMGLGKDGHVIDWGRGENRLAVRHSREKKPEDYSFNYPRFSGEEEFRNYEWRDIIKMGADYSGFTPEQIEESLKTTSTLGIKHIIGAKEIAIIAPQSTKALAVGEVISGSISGDLIDKTTGETLRHVERNRDMRTPAGSVLSIRNTLGKSSRLILTPESASDSI